MKKLILKVIVILIICFTALPVHFACGQETVNPYNRKISAGSYNVVTIKEDGTVWTWGSNSEGNLGNDSYVPEDRYYRVSSGYPVQAVDLTDVVSVSAGTSHILALKKDGTVWSWGHNYDGQLGNGNTKNMGKPVQVVGLTDVVGISAGSYKSMAVKSDGTVWVWGNNEYGQLGLDSTVYRSATPVNISVPNNIVSVSAGYDYFTAVDKNGNIWTWGNNQSCQLGDGSRVDSGEPIEALMKMGPQEDAVKPPLYIETAKLTKSNVMVNGTKISFEAYNINNNNYFKLRDIAMVLANSNKQFNVKWNEKLSSIEISTNKSYEPVGGELKVSDNINNKTAYLTESKIYLNGEMISLTAYNINGNNYFKLRDLGKYIDFGVDWNGTTNTISIDTEKGYLH